MLNKVLVQAKSGTGKTTSTRTLNPKETFIINADMKGLPYKGWRNDYQTIFTPEGKLDITKSNYIETRNPASIKRIMEAVLKTRDDIKNIVIDTITILLTAEYMGSIKEKGYDKFTNLASTVYELITFPDTLAGELANKEKNIFYLAHVDEEKDIFGNSSTKFKAVAGKMISQTIQPEAYFTIVLETEVQHTEGKSEYFFVTQNNGRNSAKSPNGMFESHLIPNDLNYVLQKIKEYES